MINVSYNVTASLAEEFPMFRYSDVEKTLIKKNGNVNATRNNLKQRSKQIGGKYKNRKTTRRNLKK